MTLEEKLLHFFHQFLAERGVPFDENELVAFHFTDSGLLDSFEILSMLVAIEMEFDLKMSPEELLDDKNATVGGLLSTLMEK